MVILFEPTKLWIIDSGFYPRYNNAFLHVAKNA